MAAIRLEGVEKTFRNGHQAVRGVDLEIGDGELLVLVGPSGCGKSTLLRLVAGLETVSTGRIWIGDRDATLLEPQDRDLAMVFQSYALYPHMTVRENLGFGLRMRRLAKDRIAARVDEVARALELDGVLDRLPRELSGGQRQRVALGRAIGREPRAFLLDEPLSNLDASLRVQTRAELAKMHRRLGATIVYVTHDQEEAMTLGERVAVLREGRIEQVGPPIEIYRAPATRFVAGFMGSPAMNLFRGAVNGSGRFVAPGITVPTAVAPIDDVWLGIRPEDIALGPPGSGDVDGVVDFIEHFGASTVVHLAVGAASLRAINPVDPTPAGTGESPPRPGTRLGARFRPGRLHFFDSATDRRRDR